MNYLLNDKIFWILDNTSALVKDNAQTFISLSLGIASILIMFVIAQEGFKLMSGNKSFDPLWWIRPLLMLFIILTWQAGDGYVQNGSWGRVGRFVKVQGSLPGMVSSVFGGLEGSAKETFKAHMARVDELKKKKLNLLHAKWDSLIFKRAEVEAAKEALADSQKEDDGFSLSDLSLDNLKESLNQSFESIKEGLINFAKLTTLTLSSGLDKILEWIGNFIWAVAVYATFMTQQLCLAFLFIFGPIHFGLSIFDTWKDAWASWLMRFISFHFYGWVAYIIMTASTSLIEFGIQADIQLLEKPGFPEAFSFNALYTLFGYIVGAMAMKMVPEIVSWIVPTNTSQAAGAFQQGLTRTFGTQPVSKAVNTGNKIAVAAASSAAPYIGAAANSVTSSVGSAIRSVTSYGYRQFTNSPPSGSSTGNSSTTSSYKNESSSLSNKPSSSSSTK